MAVAKLALMTEDEVRANYRQAADKDKQIGILAELNAVKKTEIERILFGGDAGIDPPSKRKYTRTDEATQEQIAREFCDGGITLSELAKKYGKSVPSVKKYIDKYKEKLTGSADQPELAPIAESMNEMVDPVKQVSQTMGILFETISELMERAEKETADYDVFSVVKTGRSLCCIMDKDGISVSISKDVDTTEGGAGHG